MKFPLISMLSSKFNYTVVCWGRHERVYQQSLIHSESSTTKLNCCTQPEAFTAGNRTLLTLSFTTSLANVHIGCNRTGCMGWPQSDHICPAGLDHSKDGKVQVKKVLGNCPDPLDSQIRQTRSNHPHQNSCLGAQPSHGEWGASRYSPTPFQTSLV